MGTITKKVEKCKAETYVARTEVGTVDITWTIHVDMEDYADTHIEKFAEVGR